MPFQVLNINVSQDKGLTGSWYHKPTETGILLNYLSSAPAQFKRSPIQGTLDKVFRSTPFL